MGHYSCFFFFLFCFVLRSADFACCFLSVLSAFPPRTCSARGHLGSGCLPWYMDCSRAFLSHWLPSSGGVAHMRLSTRGWSNGRTMVIFTGGTGGLVWFSMGWHGCCHIIYITRCLDYCKMSRDEYPVSSFFVCLFVCIFTKRCQQAKVEQQTEAVSAVPAAYSCVQSSEIPRSQPCPGTAK